MIYFVHLLAIYGLVFLVRSASIFSRPRRFLRQSLFIDKMLDCAFCTGIWASALLCFALPPAFSSWRGCIVFILAGATSAYVIDALILALEAAGNRVS